MNDFRPTTEAEKLEMKRKILYLANRLKCRFIDYGSYVSIEIRPMTQITKGEDDGQGTHATAPAKTGR